MQKLIVFASLIAAISAAAVPSLPVNVIAAFNILPYTIHNPGKTSGFIKFNLIDAKGKRYENVGGGWVLLIDLDNQLLTNLPFWLQLRWNTFIGNKPYEYTLKSPVSLSTIESIGLIWNCTDAKQSDLYVDTIIFEYEGLVFWWLHYSNCLLMTVFNQYRKELADYCTFSAGVKPGKEEIYDYC